MNTIVIGIAGGTGSGKTTLTRRLKEHFGEQEVSVINHDSYYKRHDELPYEERCKLNYDHPDSFDTDLMIEHLKQLRAGQSVEVPVYDYTIHNRSSETVTVNPAPVIIVEGILIFASQELCGPDGHQGLCGHRRRCPHPAAHRPRRQIPRALRLDSGGRTSISPPSSPCTSSLSSRANARQTLSSPRAARTPSRWICSSSGCPTI